MTPEPKPTVSIEWDNAIATVTMNHEPHNLLGAKLLTPLLQTLQIASSQGARAIILRSGLRHFSAGADLDLFAARASDPASTPADKATGSLTADQSTTPQDADNSGDTATHQGDTEQAELGTMGVIDRFSQIPIPIIASVHGSCLGGGLELALLCDFIIASRSAKFGCVEATLGVHPLMGAIQRISQRAGEARAKEMAILARRYDAATLERWNVINLVVDEDKLVATTTAIAKEMAAGPTVAHAATKQLAHIAVSEGVEAADRAMNQVQAQIWASEDLQIGLTSFLTSGPGLAKFEGR